MNFVWKADNSQEYHGWEQIQDLYLNGGQAALSYVFYGAKTAVWTGVSGVGQASFVTEAEAKAWVEAVYLLEQI